MSSRDCPTSPRWDRCDTIPESSLRGVLDVAIHLRFPCIVNGKMARKAWIPRDCPTSLRCVYGDASLHTSLRGVFAQSPTFDAAIHAFPAFMPFLNPKNSDGFHAEPDLPRYARNDVCCQPLHPVLWPSRASRPGVGLVYGPAGCLTEPGIVC